MPLPVVLGKSWLTGTLGADPIKRTLPIPHYAWYASKMFDYAECGLASHFLVGMRPIGTSSIRIVKNQPYFVMEWFTQTTTAPGLIDNIIYSFRDELELEIGIVTLTYTLVSGSNPPDRLGLFVNRPTTHSPHLTLEPRWDVFDQPMQPGDFWMSLSGGLRIADTNASGTNYIARPLITRLNENKEQLGVRFATGDKISGINLGVNTLIVDDWFGTVNSPGNTGSGLRNTNVNVGMYFPNSGTIAVWGDSASFTVPSGSLSVETNVVVDKNAFILRQNVEINGSSSIKTSGIALKSGSLFILGSMFGRGTLMTLTMNGARSQMKINGAQVGTLASFVQGPPTLSLSAFDGDFYLYSGSSSASGSSGYVYVRANGDWFAILSASADLSTIDAGFF